MKITVLVCVIWVIAPEFARAQFVLQAEPDVGAFWYADMSELAFDAIRSCMEIVSSRRPFSDIALKMSGLSPNDIQAMRESERLHLARIEDLARGKNQGKDLWWMQAIHTLIEGAESTRDPLRCLEVQHEMFQRQIYKPDSLPQVQELSPAK
jgi:hypothetical protein